MYLDRSRSLFCGAVFTAALFLSARATPAGEPASASPTPVNFHNQIEPMFAGRCHACHGSDKQRAGLRLDQPEALLEGSDNGPVIMPGDSGASLLVQLVSGQDPDRIMPPKGERLTPEQIALVRAWIDQGAVIAAAPATQPARGAAPASRPAHVDPVFTDPAGEEPVQQFLARRRARLEKLPDPPAPPDVAGPVFNDVDRFIIAKWHEAGLPSAAGPPPTCSNATFLRRAYLDLIGRAPTLAEARSFLDDASPDKRTRLIDALLARSDEYAAQWVPFWEEALASTHYAVVGGIPGRGNHQQWIFDSFKDNKPYDLMVAELLDPALPGHRPVTMQNVNGKMTQVGYVLNQTHEYTIQTAANVGQVFLGTGMKCASCHSHFENAEWPQDRFLSFAGLFAPQDLEVIRCEKKSGRFAPAAFAFEIPGLPADVPAELNARLHYLTLALIDPLNPRFARSIVNRLWKRYLGLGLFEPVDDFRLDSPPSHPELLDWLAHDFMTHGYDLKRMIRLILTSRTYQLEYNPALEDRFDVARRNDPRYYRSPSLRRLTAEEVLDSIRVVKDQSLRPDARLYHRIESTALTRALGRPSSRTEVSTCRPDDVAVVQSLELLNGAEFHNLVYTYDALGEALARLTPAERAEALYLAVLSRKPTDAEQALFAEFFAQADAVPARGPEERIWFDDALPPGAYTGGDAGADSWQWADNIAGRKAHTRQAVGERTQHNFQQAEPIVIQHDDVCFIEVYIEPGPAPAEIMIQWNDGSWEHRAYWGEDKIPFGQPGTPSRIAMGALPLAGQWVRLEVPAATVGFAPGARINGISFDQAGPGRVYWDSVGIATPARPDPALRDILWAMLVSPEFQYVY